MPNGPVLETFFLWYCHSCGEGPMLLELHEVCNNYDCRHTFSKECCQLVATKHLTDFPRATVGPSRGSKRLTDPDNSVQEAKSDLPPNPEAFWGLESLANTDAEDTRGLDGAVRLRKERTRTSASGLNSVQAQPGTSWRGQKEEMSAAVALDVIRTNLLSFSDWLHPRTEDSVPATPQYDIVSERSQTSTSGQLYEDDHDMTDSDFAIDSSSDHDLIQELSSRARNIFSDKLGAIYLAPRDAHTGTGGGPVVSQDRNGSKGKRKREEQAQKKRLQGSPHEDGLGSDSEADRPPKTPRPSRSKTDIMTLRLACHFYKHSPARYSSPKHRTCRAPGWDSVHRIKEHIYRNHPLQPLHCRRCQEIFEHDVHLEVHSKLVPACSPKPAVHVEGLTPGQLIALKSRKKQPGATEVQKWREVYKILFNVIDESLIPSPYCEIDNQEQYEHVRRSTSYFATRLPQIIEERIEADQRHDMSPEARQRFRDLVRRSFRQAADEYMLNEVQSSAPESHGTEPVLRGTNSRIVESEQQASTGASSPVADEPQGGSSQPEPIAMSVPVLEQRGSTGTASYIPHNSNEGGNLSGVSDLPDELAYFENIIADHDFSQIYNEWTEIPSDLNLDLDAFGRSMPDDWTWLEEA